MTHTQQAPRTAPKAMPLPALATPHRSPPRAARGRLVAAELVTEAHPRSRGAVVPMDDWQNRMVHVLTQAHQVVKRLNQHMAELLAERYGKKGPTYAQYRADMALLRKTAKARGLSSDQWLRKPFAAFVKIRYGELPVSPKPAAQAKRLQREKKRALTSAARGAEDVTSTSAVVDLQPLERSLAALVAQYSPQQVVAMLGTVVGGKAGRALGSLAKAMQG